MLRVDTKSLKTLALAVLLSLPLAACSTTAGTYSSEEIDDPFQGFNKAVFAFNDGADTVLLRPVAMGYRQVVPEPVRTGLRNFLRNLRAPVNFTNEVLQGDFQGAGNVFTRTAVNTLIGLGGVVDVAAMEGLPYEQEDFGQTLAVWGVGHGPYMVLPILGPSSMRDGAGLLVDGLMDPLSWYLRNTDQEEWMYARMGAEGLVKREELLDVLDDLRRNSFDYYAAMRSAYVQRRSAMVRDVGGVNAAASEAIPDYSME